MILWIISGKNALQVCLMFFFIAAGVPSVFGAPAPNSTSALLDPEAVHVWGACLTLGSLGVLIGTYWRDRQKPERPLLLEMASAFFLTPSMMIYPVGVVIAALQASSGVRLGNAWFAAIITTGFAVACFARGWQCLRDWRQAREFRLEIKESS